VSGRDTADRKPPNEPAFPRSLSASGFLFPNNIYNKAITMPSIQKIIVKSEIHVIPYNTRNYGRRNFTVQKAKKSVCAIMIFIS
jgi:hypothetical protein